MRKIIIYLPISFFLIGVGCAMFTNEYVEIRYTIMKVSFLLSIVSLFVSSIYIKKTGGRDHHVYGDHHVGGDHLSGDE